MLVTMSWVNYQRVLKALTMFVEHYEGDARWATDCDAQHIYLDWAIEVEDLLGDLHPTNLEIA